MSNIPFPGLTAEDVAERMTALGHTVFSGAGNPTCVSIRAHTRMAGQWDDQHMVITVTPDGNLRFVATGRGTTDASDDYLTGRRRPHPHGTAVAMPGQHRGCWLVGPNAYHGRSSGKPYLAFEQVGPISYMRDNDGDDVLDTPTSGYCQDEEDFDVFKNRVIQHIPVYQNVIKMNWHTIRGKVAPARVGPYSAGCPVWMDPDEFEVARKFCADAAPAFGERVSWCLLDQWFDIGG